MKTTMFGMCAVAVAMSALGCLKHNYVYGTGGNMQGEPKYSEWHSHWAFGLVGDESVDVKSVCPSGNATVTNKVSFVNALIAGVAVGGLIYSPTTVEVYCGADAKSAQVELTADQARKIALRPETVEQVRQYSPEKAEQLAKAIQDYQHQLAQTAF